jgi:hypothetical protein
MVVYKSLAELTSNFSDDFRMLLRVSSCVWVLGSVTEMVREQYFEDGKS